MINSASVIAIRASLAAQTEKESACNAEDLGLIPGLGRTTGEGNGYPLQYSCLENSMDRGTLWAILHGVTKSQTTLHFNGNKHVNLGKRKSM